MVEDFAENLFVLRDFVGDILESSPRVIDFLIFQEDSLSILTQVCRDLQLIGADAGSFH